MKLAKIMVLLGVSHPFINLSLTIEWLSKNTRASTIKKDQANVGKYGLLGDESVIQG